MSGDDAVYDVHALRYTSKRSSKSHSFYRYGMYREEDAPLDMEFYFWLIRNGQRTVLLDTGLNIERGIDRDPSLVPVVKTDPLELLARMDVRAEDVDHVVVSHMHVDHAGNLEAFPNATFSMTRAEYEFCTGPLARRELVSVLCDPREVEILRSLRAQERLQLVDDTAEVLPGITVTRLGGHSPGQAMTEVATRDERLVLASDAIHFYEEMERDRPFSMFTELNAMYEAYDTLRELEACPGTSVIAGHDDRLRSRYETVVEDCIDLTRRVA